MEQNKTNVYQIGPKCTEEDQCGPKWTKWIKYDQSGQSAQQ